VAFKLALGWLVALQHLRVFKSLTGATGLKIWTESLELELRARKYIHVKERTSRRLPGGMSSDQAPSPQASNTVPALHRLRILKIRKPQASINLRNSPLPDPHSSNAYLATRNRGARNRVVREAVVDIDSVSRIRVTESTRDCHLWTQVR
jgi:hypothetical protein